VCEAIARRLFWPQSSTYLELSRLDGGLVLKRERAVRTTDMTCFASSNTLSCFFIKPIDTGHADQTAWDLMYNVNKWGYIVEIAN